MKTVKLLVLLFSIHMAARADFSYTSTRKTTGGAMAAMAGGAANGVSKVYFKGRKLKTENGDTATLIDMDAQTITIVSNAQKTFTVRSLNGSAGSQTGAGITVDVKETGQRKTINGFDARELALTMELEMGQGRGMGGKMQVEVDLWIASNVPGKEELRSFYSKNGDFPWAAAAGGSNSGMQSAMAEIQKKIASMDGVPVEQVIRVKPAGGVAAAQMPAMPQMSPTQSAQMDQARARLEAMKAQGGPQAAMAEQALASMGAITGGRGAAAGTGGTLLEMTVDSTDFSTSAIPDFVFAIPAGYQKTEAK